MQNTNKPEKITAGKNTEQKASFSLSFYCVGKGYRKGTKERKRERERKEKGKNKQNFTAADNLQQSN